MRTDPRGGPRPRSTGDDRGRPAEARHRAAGPRAHHVDCRTVMSRLLLLIVLACAAFGFAACGGDTEETVTRRRVRGRLRDARRAAVPGAALAPARPVRAGRPRPPQGRARRAARPEGRRDLVRGVGAGPERHRGSAADGRRVPHQGHDRARVRAGPAGRHQPVRLPLRGARGRPRRVPAAQQRVGAGRRRRAPSCSSGCPSRRWTSARSSSSSRAPRSRARSPRSAWTSEPQRGQPRCRPAARISRAAGAAVSPPAPAPTSRTPTAIRGVRPAPAGA